MKNRYFIIALILALAAILALRLVASHADWLERGYLQHFYPGWSSVLLTLTGSFPFTLFEWLIAGTLLYFITVFLKGLIAWRRKKRTFLRALGWTLLRVGSVSAFLYAWFLLSWGLNYFRPPLENDLAIAGQKPEAEQFAVVSRWANRALCTLPVTPTEAATETATQAAMQALDCYLQEMGVPVPATPVRIKRFLWNYPLAATRTSGIISPFTLELHLSADLFPEEIPFLAAHEAVHIRGFASEAEANFLAFEACLASGDSLARFSAFFSVFHYLSSGLLREERQALVAQWPDEVKKLAQRIYERNKQYEGTLIARASRIFYDFYLKSHAVKEGIKSYSRVGGWIALLHHEAALAELETD